MAERVDVLSALRRSYLFEDVTTEDLRPLAAATVVRRLVPREVLWPIGAPADEIAVAVSGEVKATVVNLDGDEVIHSVYGPGMTFGEPGFFASAHGLACDNLIGADVVTASGEVVHADDANRPDLRWGLRGGGGNFGIVSSFEFALHPVSTVLGGLMPFGWDQAGEVLATFREWTATLPDEGSMLAAVMTAPPEPFVPEHLVGRPVLGIVGCWCGDVEAGQAALGTLRELKPAVDLFDPIPYPALQGMLDGGAPSGVRNYFRAGYADELSDALIEVVLEHGSQLPSPMSAVHIHQMGGAVGRVAADATAFGNRGAAFAYNLVSTWTDAREDEQHIDANRAFAAALEPASTGCAYVNFLGDEGNTRIRAAYGESTYDRLGDSPPRTAERAQQSSPRVSATRIGPRSRPPDRSSTTW